jgi:hypothetical protein
MRAIFLLLSFFLFLKASACDCGHNGPFLQMARQTKLVALVKVVKYSSFSKSGEVPHAVEVEILEVLKGKETRKRIEVWGDNGRMCRPFVSGFAIDSLFVMSLDHGKTQPGHTDEKETDYSISNCGCFWLPANQLTKTVTGYIIGEDGKAITMTLKRLKADLHKNNR